MHVAPPLSSPRAKALLLKTPRAKSPAVNASGSRMPGEDRRRQLIDVAIQVFARNGFGGTKTKDIAAAAGVSEAIVFRHFASKEDLYHAILDAKEGDGSADQLIAKLQKYVDLRDDAGLFECIARSMLKSFRQDPAFHRLLLYARLEGHLLAGLFHERFGLPIGDFLRKYIISRQKEGVFRPYDPHMAVMLAMGSILHLAMARNVFQRKPPVSEETAIRELVEFILGGLTVSSGARPGKSIRTSTTQKEKEKEHGHAKQ